MANPPPLHIDGRAGRGKTYLLYPVIGALRKLDEIVLLSASSAFAAKNYPGGRTAHYLYGIPVDEYNPFLKSLVRPKSDRAKLLLAAKCHIVDEIGALHFKAFDCADRLMRELTQQSNKVWGGRMLITVGDFRQVSKTALSVPKLPQLIPRNGQVAPVVRFGGRTAICKASLRTQDVFKWFEILRLEVSIRQRNDPEFSKFLDDIGDDVENDFVDLTRLPHTTSITDVIDFVFPAEILDHPEECIKRAILSPFNTFVDQFNSTIRDSVPGSARTYLSSDTVEGDEGIPTGALSVLSDPEFLNSLQEPGIPPHELTLKVGAICRFTRNFDPSRGLTKNTRVIVRALFRYTVEVETIPAVVAGIIINAVCTSHPLIYFMLKLSVQVRLHIPRINFHFQPAGFNFIVHRKQMPLALCYATTFNGCQGLTVKKLALDLRRAVFSHGQLYSAMTRVPDAKNVMILKYEDELDKPTNNIVWQELLL
jgi:ATP-dependent DNA helicase PIF1